MTQIPLLPEFMLTVQRADLEKGIKTAIFGIKKRTAGDFSLLYANGQLTLRGPVAEATVPAQGNWPITVCLPPQVAKNLVNVLPSTDPLHLSFIEGRLYIEKFSLAGKRAA